MTGIGAWLIGSKLGRGALTAAVVVVLGIGAYWYVSGLKSDKAALQAQLAAVSQERDEAEAGLAKFAEQIKRNAELTAAESQREETTGREVETIIKEVYRDRPPTPDSCRAVLDPISDALDGVRRLRAPNGDAG